MGKRAEPPIGRPPRPRSPWRPELSWLTPARSGPARFGGLPIVPDRAAFSTAIEHEAKDNQAEHNGQSPGHTRSPLTHDWLHFTG